MFSSKRPIEDIEVSEDTTTHVMKNDSAMLKEMLKKVTEREA